MKKGVFFCLGIGIVALMGWKAYRSHHKAEINEVCLIFRNPPIWSASR